MIEWVIEYVYNRFLIFNNVFYKVYFVNLYNDDNIVLMQESVKLIIQLQKEIQGVKKLEIVKLILFLNKNVVLCYYKERFFIGK